MTIYIVNKLDTADFCGETIAVYKDKVSAEKYIKALHYLDRQDYEIVERELE